MAYSEPCYRNRPSFSEQKALLRRLKVWEMCHELWRDLKGVGMISREKAMPCGRIRCTDRNAGSTKGLSLALTVISRLIGPSDVGKWRTMIKLEIIAVAHIKRADLGSRAQYKHIWFFISGEDVYTGSWRP